MEKQLNKKEPGITGLGNSQPFQIMMLKRNKWLLGKDQIQGVFSKTWSKDEPEDVIVKYFVKTSKITKKRPQRSIWSNSATKKLTGVVPQQSWHEPKVEKSLSHKDLCVWFKRILLAGTLEGTETVLEGNRTSDPQSFPVRKQAKEVVELEAWRAFHGKGRMTRGRAKCLRESIIVGQD